MSWFAAHAIMYLKCLDGPQDTYVVWENVYLIEATDRQAAFDSARSRAHLEEASEDELYLPDGRPRTTCFGRPARWICAGIRKVVDVSHISSEDALGSGDEVTYNAFTFSREPDIAAFADGDDIALQCDDQLSTPPGTARW